MVAEYVNMIIWPESSVDWRLWGTIWWIWLVAVEAESLIVNFCATQMRFFDVQRKKSSDRIPEQKVAIDLMLTWKTALSLWFPLCSQFLHLTQMELEKLWHESLGKQIYSRPPPSERSVVCFSWSCLLSTQSCQHHVKSVHTLNILMIVLFK